VKRALAITGMVLLILVSSLSASSAEPPAIVITRPTIIAFCRPIDTKTADEETNEVLADFQTYTARLPKPLQTAGIEFHELYVHSFRIRAGGRVKTFRPGKVYLGFYFIAPGRAPHVEYGVHTDDEILEIATEYFRHSSR
jgi:hypothetical protein